MATYIKNIEVSDDFIELVLETLGYPIIDKETLFDIFSEEYIKNNIIAPSMELFFNYFPIIKEFTMSSNTTINSPVENVLGILHYTKNDGDSLNVDYSKLGAFGLSTKLAQQSGGSTYGTPFNYNSYTYSTFQQKFYNDSLKNLGGGRKFTVTYNVEDNTFCSHSISQGTIHVEVGCWSNKVSDIPNRLQSKFLDLCKSEIGMKFAKVVNLVDVDLPLAIDSDQLLDDSKDLKESTIEWLETNSHYTVMK